MRPIKTKVIGALVRAAQELSTMNTMNTTREALAASCLRQLPPQDLKGALDVVRLLKQLIEQVAVEQVATWSSEEISQMQDRVNDQMLKEEDQ